MGAIGKGAGMPVKIAGIAAGLAGAAGLGKMIIDSSPVMKSMLKLLNVGIMLILRPIGDFIGFMLRPLLIEFVRKVAIPAYRQGARFAKEWGTKMGKALLLLFTNPAEFLQKAIVNPIVGSFLKGIAGIERWWRVVGVLLNPFNFNKEEEIAKIKAEEAGTNAAIDALHPGLDVGQNTELGQALKKFNEASNAELYGKDQEIFGGAFACTGEGGVATDGTLGEFKTKNEEQLARIIELTETLRLGEEMKAIGDSIIVSLEESLGLDDKADYSTESQQEYANRIAQEWRDEQIAAEKKRQETIDRSIPNYANPFFACGGAGRPEQGHIFPGGQGFDKWSEGNEVLKRFRDYQQGGTGSQAQSSSGKPFAIGGAKTREQMENYDEVVNISNLIKDLFCESGQMMVCVPALTDIMVSAMRSGQGDFDLIPGITEHMIDTILATDAYITKRANALSIALKSFVSTNKGYQAIIRSSGSDTCGAINTTPDKQPNVGQWANYRLTWAGSCAHKNPDERYLHVDTYKAFLKTINSDKSQGLTRIQRFAMGGIINEPIFGLGQRTGKAYSFGETGPETITPGTSGHRGVGPTFNITIHATGIHDVERQLKPAILKLLKESTARTGIVWQI